jgi:hypothetical protein
VINRRAFRFDWSRKGAFTLVDLSRTTPCFDSINQQAFRFDWSRKGAFTLVDLSRTTPSFDAINRRAFRFNWSRKTLLSFDSIVSARLNRLCKHPHSELCRLFVYLVVNYRNVQRSCALQRIAVEMNFTMTGSDLKNKNWRYITTFTSLSVAVSDKWNRNDKWQCKHFQFWIRPAVQWPCDSDRPM